MNVNGKVVVVTGAGNGMGREVTLELLRRGARVAAVDINSSALADTVALAAHMHTNISTHMANVANLADVSALPSAVIAAHQQVDGLINVAGVIHKFKKVADLDYADIERVFQINFFGSVYMVKEFLPHLRQRPAAQILNVSSMGGYVPVPGQTMYGASKAALKLFTEGLRSELKGSNVGVSLLFPGAIATNIAVNSGIMTAAESEAMTKQAGNKFKSTPVTVAGKLIVDAFEQNLFHAFAGSDAKTMDILSRIAPEYAANLIQSQMAQLLS